LIRKSNEYLHKIETEIIMLHKFARDMYAARFPDLESIIINPLDYVKCAKAIGNENDLSKIDL
jgi:U4/U6 small nuclear ribonucleoprotein PRP31